MNLIERAKNVLLQPKAEWPIIDVERTTAQELFTNYILILAAIGPLASWIGMSVFGIELPFVGRIRTPLLSGLLPTLVTYGLGLLGMFLLAKVINFLAPTFGGIKDPTQALKVAAYACTATWVGGVFSLMPALAVFGLLAGLYSLYLLYTGLPVIMKSSPDRSLAYTVSVVLVGIVVGFLLTAVFAAVGGPLISTPIALTGSAGVDETSKHLESFAKGMDVLAKNLEKAAQQGSAGASKTAGRTADEVADQPGQDMSPQEAMKAVSDALTGMGETITAGKNVEPADFRQLKALLPESLPGLERGDATGGREALFGIDRSEARATYTGADNRRITVEVMDVGGALGTLGVTAFSWAAQGAVIDKETGSGYEKTTTYRGFKAFEQFDRARNHGEISLLVNDHAGVTVTGENVPIDALRGALDRIDLNALAATRIS